MKLILICYIIICLCFYVIHCARLTTTSNRILTQTTTSATEQELESMTILSLGSTTIKPKLKRNRLAIADLESSTDQNIKGSSSSPTLDGSSLKFGQKILKNNAGGKGSVSSKSDGNKRATVKISTTSTTAAPPPKKKSQQLKKYIPVHVNLESNIKRSGTIESIEDNDLNGPTKFVLPNAFIKTSTTAIPKEKPRKSLTGPTKFVLPNAFIQTSTTARPKEKPRKSRGTILICPKEAQAHYNLFAPNCRIDKDCLAWDKDSRCCNIFGGQSCTKGVPKPVQEESHTPIFGFIQRKCPTVPLAELWWEIQTCETDNDCWPRICCPDGRKKYCRTSKPTLDAMPAPVSNSISYLTEFLECTSPPPPIFDLHPKPCGSTFDCFPNVCCQESGKKHCRPPKKSLLTLMANFFNLGLVKRLTNSLAIK